MKILKVNIAKANLDRDGVLNLHGLEDVEMKRLGKIVIIAGKNGAGKTRLITAIKHAFYGYPAHTLKQEIESIIKEGTLSDSDMKRKYGHVLSAMNSLTLSEDKVSNQVILDFVPKSLEIRTSNSTTKSQIKHAYNTVKEVAPEEPIQGGSFNYINHLQSKFIHATHPETKISEKEKLSVVDEYKQFKLLLESILETSLDITPDGDFTLYGFQEENMSLSDGQKILLQFCVELHAKGGQLNNLMLFLDEPENHLHPSVLLEVIDKISNVITDGQIWIATHSVNLIAHLPDSSLYYIEKGKVDYVGNKPQNMIEGLLGDEGERNRLTDFIDLPYRYAEMKFCYECLHEATVLLTEHDDPQIHQVRKILLEIPNNGKKLKVLDYGAGKGRLIKYFDESVVAKNNSVTNRLDYIAFDESAHYEKDCKENIKMVYGSSEDRYFNEFSEVVRHSNKEKFDVVIMMNVFHEIEPDKWLGIFSKGGEIDNVLRENGKLLIIEHQVLNYGEMAHSKGFLMFDKEEFKVFFGFNDDDETAGKYKIEIEKLNGELKAHFIDKSLLTGVTLDSKKNSIEKLQDSSINEIIEIKKKKPATLKNGRKLAFWSQQLANATIALKHLDNN